MAAAVDKCLLLFPSLLSCKEIVQILSILEPTITSWFGLSWVVPQLFNILSTKTLLNNLPTFCPLWNKVVGIKATQIDIFSAKSPLNNIPTSAHCKGVVMLEVMEQRNNSNIFSTYSHQFPHWGNMGMGITWVGSVQCIERKWVLCWFYPHILPTSYLSHTSSIAPTNL